MPVRASRWLREHEADLVSLLASDHPRVGLLNLTEQLGKIGSWWVNLPDYTITWSDEVYRIHGVTRDSYDPELETAVGFFHPDDRDAFRAAVTTAARDELPFTFSLRLVRKDTELRYVKCRGVTIRGPDGVPEAIFGVLIDVSEQQEVNLKLEKIAYVDVLTRLANRRQFDEVLEREWHRAVREQNALSLIMLDVDRFKSFNDLYGHLAGDECLQTVAGALAYVVHRPADLVARYGGEEFAVILPATGAVGAEEVAYAVRAAVAALGITHAGNISCGGSVTASLGVCTAYPQQDGPTSAWFALIAEADALLYEAKRTGRNRVVSSACLGQGGSAPLPENEEERLAALAIYEQAGAARRTSELDRIAQLAAKLTSSPIGLVTLFGSIEQKFIGSHGLEGVDGMPRDLSFCSHTILGNDPLVVPDMTRDSRFEANPFVTGAFHVRYYAGAPILSEASGQHVGTVCIIDKSARAETSPAQRALLTDLAKMAFTLLEEKVSSPVSA